MRREPRSHGPPYPSPCWNPPDPESARTETRESYLAAMAQLISDTSHERCFAFTVIALVTGFGESVTRSYSSTAWTSTK